MTTRKSDELIVIVKIYDLILWSSNHTSRFPRIHRFVLGERIERGMYDLLEMLIQAKYTRENKAILDALAEPRRRKSASASGSIRFKIVEGT